MTGPSGSGATAARVRGIALAALAWAAVLGGFDRPVGADEARASTAERVRADIEQFILERVDRAPSAIEVPELRAFDFDVSGASGEIRTELSTGSPLPLHGRIAIAVSLFVGDRLIKRGIVSPYVSITERVVVATQALARGRVIARGDLVLVERDRADAPADAVRDPESVVGLRTRRSIGGDRILRSSDFESVPVVERGDRVTIVLQHGPLVIQTLGKAQETGAAGEWIRVVNLDSKREVSGRIDPEGRVHVAF